LVVMFSFDNFDGRSRRATLVEEVRVMASLTVSTQNLSDITKAVSQQASALASAWSEAATQYADWFREQAAVREVAESERAERMVKELGRAYDDLAGRARQWADAASDTGIGRIIKKYADYYGAQAASLADEAASVEKRAAAIIAEARQGVVAAENVWGGGYGRAVGPAFDMAQMVDSAMSWAETGQSDAFGEAAAGVIMSAAAGAIVGSIAAAVGAPAIAVAIAAGIAAGLASASAGMVWNNFIKPIQENSDLWDKVFGGIDKIVSAVNSVFRDATTPIRRDPQGNCMSDLPVVCDRSVALENDINVRA
jgi:hypothetical protein